MEPLTTQASALSGAVSSRWVGGAAFDVVFLWSGLWLSALAIVAVVLDGGVDGEATTSALSTMAMALAATVWIGHRASSALVAYTMPSYRSLLRAETRRFVVVPALTALAVVIFVVPEGLWPWTFEVRVVVLAAVDYAFVSFHFAAQHTGVLALYRSRSGLARSDRHRLVHRAFAFAVGGAVVVVIDAVMGHAVVPDALAARITAFNDVAHVVVRVAGAVTVMALVVVVAIDRPWSLPRLVYVLSIAVMVLLAVVVDPLVFVVVWTAQHWLVAIGLASRQGGPTDVASAWYRAWHVVTGSPRRVVVALVLVSVVLYPVMEAEATLDGARLVPWLWPDDAAVAFPLAFRVVVAMGFASAFVHYLLDRAIYGFRDARVRTAAASLLAPPTSG